MHIRQTARLVVPVVLLIAACGNPGDDAAPVTSGPKASTTAATTTTTTRPETTTTVDQVTSTAAPTTTTMLDADLLVGIWRTSQSDILVEFKGDGSHNVSYLNRIPFDFGPYTLDGDQLTLTSLDGSEVCPDLTGVYRIAISETGDELRFTFVSDSCFSRANALALPATRYVP